MAEAADDAAEDAGEGGATAAASNGAGGRLGTGDPPGPGLPETARAPQARRLGGRTRGGERRRRPRAGGAGSRELTAIGGSSVAGLEGISGKGGGIGGRRWLCFPSRLVPSFARPPPASVEQGRRQTADVESNRTPTLSNQPCPSSSSSRPCCHSYLPLAPPRIWLGCITKVSRQLCRIGKKQVDFFILLRNTLLYDAECWTTKKDMFNSDRGEGVSYFDEMITIDLKEPTLTIRLQTCTTL